MHTPALDPWHTPRGSRHRPLHPLNHVAWTVFVHIHPPSQSHGEATAAAPSPFALYSHFDPAAASPHGASVHVPSPHPLPAPPARTRRATPRALSLSASPAYALAPVTPVPF